MGAFWDLVSRVRNGNGVDSLIELPIDPDALVACGGEAGTNDLGELLTRIANESGTSQAKLVLRSDGAWVLRVSKGVQRNSECVKAANGAKVCKGDQGGATGIECVHVDDPPLLNDKKSLQDQIDKIVQGRSKANNKGDVVLFRNPGTNDLHVSFVVP